MVKNRREGTVWSLASIWNVFYWLERSVMADTLRGKKRGVQLDIHCGTNSSASRKETGMPGSGGTGKTDGDMTAEAGLE